jgi:trk system potassium uptake protein TrkH
VTLYGLATLVGVLYGIPLDQAAFEAVSAASNTGLSCGVTGPMMPSIMKVTYIGAMWLGRLEFMSVFALVGYAWSIARGK